MMRASKLPVVTEEIIVNKIYSVRDQKVMIDRDLAELYGVETKRLKEAVRRNKEKFPKDFMFEMTPKEFENWRTQFATSKSDLLGLRYSPFCFTEQGVTMLACILNSKRAIAVNIQIIRIFTKLRKLLLGYKDILLRFEKVEKKLIKHDREFQIVFKYLKRLFAAPAEPPRRRIGFRRKGQDEEQSW